MESAIIREIEPGDNAEVAEVIRKVLIDLGVPKVGTAYADKALDHMYENYDVPRADYFVVEDNGKLSQGKPTRHLQEKCFDSEANLEAFKSRLSSKIIGGAGVAQLEHYEGNVCELQKMYFLEEAQGRGLGTKMIELCLQRAKEYGFEQCYLETMPYMHAAQKLYLKSGFKYIDAPMGDTGHYSCPVWMLKDL